MKLTLEQFKKEIGLPAITPALADKVADFKVRMISKSSENIDFMASPYIGAHRIVFTDNDVENFFFSIGMALDTIVDAIKKIEYIKPNWKSPRIPMNLIPAILITEAHNSSITGSKRDELIVDLSIISQFRYLTSLYSQYFPIIADISLIKAVYENMYKYNLNKQYGSNYAVLEHRARLLVNNRTHLKKLDSGKIEDIVYIISDMSNAIRSMTKIWYGYLEEAKENAERINTTSIITRGDEGDKIGDIENAHAKYLATIKDKISNEYEFINPQRIDLLLELIPRISKRKVITVLEYIKEAYTKNPQPIIDLIEKDIKVCIKYLFVNKTLYPPYVSRTGLVIKLLKNLFSSSNVRDSDMKIVKTELFEISKKSLRSRNKQTNLSIAIVLAVYLFLIAIS